MHKIVKGNSIVRYCSFRRISLRRKIPLRARKSQPRHRRAVSAEVTTPVANHAYLTTVPLPFIKEFDCFQSKLPTTRLKVAVDVDEVLGQFLVALNNFVGEHYGMQHNVEDYHVYHFATIWGCSQDFSTRVVHEFFESPHFWQLPLVPGAFEALCELQKWCDLHVVTSRQHIIRDITIQWLSTHYPGIFTSVHFGNHFSKEGGQRKKSEMCKEMCADVLIDDNPEYAMDCASAGIHVLLYNWQKGYPWSRAIRSHNRIQEINCWSQVPDTLKGMFQVDDGCIRAHMMHSTASEL